jgi:hypothetical protein
VLETRAADSLTVAWMVCVCAVFLCDVAAAAAHLGSPAPTAGPPGRIAVLGSLLLLAGGITGLLTLVLLPVLQRVRRTPVPHGIVVFAVCASIAPLLALAAVALR